VSAEVVDHSPAPVLAARRPAAGRVLVAISGDAATDGAAKGMAMSEMFANAEFDVLSVVDTRFEWYAPLDGTGAALALQAQALPAQRAEHRAAATEFAAQLRSLGRVASGACREGRPADEILLAAKEHGADVIIVGSHGYHGVRRMLLGSVGREVLHHAGASVLIARSLVGDPTASASEFEAAAATGR
jgi:nucleotide-binding universal stress UspA family protein